MLRCLRRWLGALCNNFSIFINDWITYKDDMNSFLDRFSKTLILLHVIAPSSMVNFLKTENKSLAYLKHLLKILNYSHST